MAQPHTHPVFARVYSVVAALGEHGELGRWRSEVLAAASGRLLVVGIGPGHDLDHLPPAVTEVIAVEPDPTMRKAARHRAAHVRVPVQVLDGVAEQLPLDDESVDAVLYALVLCSVDDQVVALREAHRVLRPGGTLHVLEHVRAPEGSLLGRVQDAVEGVWRRGAGGCRPNRRTADAIAAAGFDPGRLAHARLSACVPLVAPHLRGVTVR